MCDVRHVQLEPNSQLLETLSTALHEMSKELGLEKEWIEGQLSHSRSKGEDYNYVKYVAQQKNDARLD